MGHYNVRGYYDVEDYLNYNPDYERQEILDEDNIEIDLDNLEEVETLLDNEEE